MNGFHVHAVGWVLTASAFSLRPAEAGELSALWEDLLRAHAEDRARAPLLFRLLAPRSIRLSDKSVEAFAALLERMATRHPERFGGDALRSRRNQWAFHAALGFVLCGLASTLLPATWPLVGAVVPTFFLMGCLSLLPAIILWRAARAAHYCSAHHHVTTGALPGLSGHRAEH